ncbi:MAG TPA: N-acetylmuramoyl-L-alanine amidase [Bacillales bacterium]|nr:N-acetylmuramoyl-L-alanine amidase [Bacillales bacterium]
MKTIVMDPGHGGKDEGAIYGRFQEKKLNLELSLKVRQKLLERYRVKVMMTRSKDISMGPNERAMFANRHRADHFCSIHHHAEGNSFKSFIYNGNAPPETTQVQSRLHFMIIQELAGYNIQDQGQSQADYQVLQQATMPAILLEMPFIAYEKESRSVTDPMFRGQMASAIADGLARALHLPAAEKPLYSVIAGSFKVKEDARDRASFLEQQQIDTFIDKTELSGDLYYRVQAGAFRRRENAKQHARELKRMGLGDVFIATGNAPVKHQSSQTTILGDTHFDADKLDEYARHLNPDAPRLGQYYADFGKHYGVRGDIAFAQALHVTNDFRFTGSINPEQHNYCGLGAISSKQATANFSTPQNGVLAHIQHLYAYASTDPLPEGYPLVDPHFKFVSRGSAKTWLELNGKWTISGVRYGEAILQKYEQMADYMQRQTPSQDASLKNRIKRWLKKLFGRNKS